MNPDPGGTQWLNVHSNLQEQLNTHTEKITELSTKMDLMEKDLPENYVKKNWLLTCLLVGIFALIGGAMYIFAVQFGDYLLHLITSGGDSSP